MKYFDVLIGREDVTEPKPNPEGVLKAVKELRHRSGIATFFIGDSCVDMMAAEEAEIAGIGVLTGYTSKDELLDCADFVTKDAFAAVVMAEKI